MLRRLILGRKLPVTFLAASETLFTSSSTHTVAIPDEAAPGSLLLAYVMHRSAVTPPPGWELVIQSDAASDINQWVSVYKKEAEAGDAGSNTTWTLASSGRNSVHIQAYTSGAVVGSSKWEGPVSTTVTTPPVDIGGGQIGIVATTVGFQALTGPGPLSSSGTNWVQTTPTTSGDTGNQVRMGVAYRKIPGISENTFSIEVESAWTGVTILLG